MHCVPIIFIDDFKINNFIENTTVLFLFKRLSHRLLSTKSTEPI